MTTRLPAAAPVPWNEALWRCTSYGVDRHEAGSTYFWDNRRRPRNGSLVFQFSLTPAIEFCTPVQVWPVPAGGLMIFGSGEASWYGQRQPLTEVYRCLWVQARGAGLAEHVAAFVSRHGPVLPLDLQHPLRGQIEQLIAAASPGSRRTLLEQATLLHRLVIAIFQLGEHRRDDHAPAVERAVDAILERPYAEESLKQWAFRFDVSREHLSRTFTARVGQPPHEFVAAARRRQALTLLTQTQLSLDEVARQAGYVSRHTLARQVRQATGQSPIALRLAARA